MCMAIKGGGDTAIKREGGGGGDTAIKGEGGGIQPLRGRWGEYTAIKGGGGNAVIKGTARYKKFFAAMIWYERGGGQKLCSYDGTHVTYFMHVWKPHTHHVLPPHIW